ncbi:glycosyltransferase family 9 protein [Candidatus Poribacteria bacterium]|nr:glycosyltransferase family 9 protein [Candidatus Poribacteria bacterium]
MTPGRSPRIYVTQTGGWIGDMVLMGPALRALKKRFPGSHVCLHVRSHVADMMASHPYLDEVLAWDKDGAESGWRSTWRWREQLSAGRWDIAVVAHPTSVRSAALAWASGIPVRVGGARVGWKPILTATVPDAGCHERDRYLRIVGLAGVPPVLDEERQTFFWHTAEHRLEAAAFLNARRGSPHKPLIAMNLGTTWRSKAWPVERFADVARHVARQGNDVVVTGGQSERAARDAFAQSMADVPFIDAVEAGDIFVLGALLEASDCCVTADSGPMHIAAAVGTPVVALFGSTSPSRHGPDGECHEVFYARLPCAPCYERDCPLTRNRYGCMDAHSPQAVAEAVGRILGTSQPV